MRTACSLQTRTRRIERMLARARFLGYSSERLACTMLSRVVRPTRNLLSGLRTRVHVRGMCGPTTFYSSQSGVTVDLPTGIHLHDVGLHDTSLPENEEERVAWEKILTSYASSNAIHTVELPPELAATGELDSGQVWAQRLLGSDTAMVISEPAGAANGSGANSIVAVTAAVGKVDGLDPDESVENAVGAATKVSHLLLHSENVSEHASCNFPKRARDVFDTL